MAPSLEGERQKAITNNPEEARCDDSIKVIVSKSTYKHFDPCYHSLSNQPRIYEYFSEIISRDGFFIKALAERVKWLQENQKTDNSNILDEAEGIGFIRDAPTANFFFKELVSLSQKRASGKVLRYDLEAKEICLYYFLLGGRRLYEYMSSQLPIPSVSTVLRFLYSDDHPSEGKFDYEGFKKFNDGDTKCSYVWASEDDTKITEGLSYLNKDDVVVGLMLPLNKTTGTPISGVYKFTSIKTLKKFVNENELSTYMKLILLRALNHKSKPYVLCVYGTRGSDLSEDVANRWCEITKCLAAVGITVLGKSKLSLT